MEYKLELCTYCESKFEKNISYAKLKLTFFLNLHPPVHHNRNRFAIAARIGHALHLVVS